LGCWNQAQKAVDELSLFFFSNPTVSLRLIEDSHLKAAFAGLGVKIPCRTSLSTTLLDKQYSAAIETTLHDSFGGVLDESTAAAAADDMDVFGLGTLPVLAKAFALASDGWRTKACGQGVPLINLLVIPDEGPAVFIKVGGYGVSPVVARVSLVADMEMHCCFMLCCAMMCCTVL
jgi:hypothetical protein